MYLLKFSAVLVVLGMATQWGCKPNSPPKSSSATPSPTPFPINPIQTMIPGSALPPSSVGGMGDLGMLRIDGVSPSAGPEFYFPQGSQTVQIQFRVSGGTPGDIYVFAAGLPQGAVLNNQDPLNPSLSMQAVGLTARVQFTMVARVMSLCQSSGVEAQCQVPPTSFNQNLPSNPSYDKAQAFGINIGVAPGSNILSGMLPQTGSTSTGFMSVLSAILGILPSLGSMLPGQTNPNGIPPINPGYTPVPPVYTPYPT